MPSGVFLSKTELRGDKQRHGRVVRDVLDGGGAIALEISAGAFRVQSEHDSILRLCVSTWDFSTFWIGKGHNLGGGEALASPSCSRAWAGDPVGIFEVRRRTRPADMWTKVVLVARLNVLRAACGILVPGHPTCEPIDEGADDCTVSCFAIV